MKNIMHGQLLFTKSLLKVILMGLIHYENLSSYLSLIAVLGGTPDRALDLPTYRRKIPNIITQRNGAGSWRHHTKI